jgi:tRNA pseudouridine55 synthase
LKAGFLLFNKPTNISSNKALQKVRSLFNRVKAGHAGSLDPLASGMLPIFFGKATSLLSLMLEAPKSYRVKILFGVSTKTGDREGEVIAKAPIPSLSENDLRECFQRFEGEQEQIPPMYSALKVKGQPLYRYARAGLILERSPRSIVIHQLELESYSEPYCVCTVSCSKGTYIRSLVEDLGKALGCGACVFALDRISVGQFDPKEMVSWEVLENSDEEKRSSYIPVWRITEEGLEDVQQGRVILRDTVPEEKGWWNVQSVEGEWLGLVCRGEEKIGRRLLFF